MKKIFASYKGDTLEIISLALCAVIIGGIIAGCFLLAGNSGSKEAESDYIYSFLLAVKDSADSSVCPIIMHLRYDSFAQEIECTSYLPGHDIAESGFSTPAEAFSKAGITGLVKAINSSCGAEIRNYALTDTDTLKKIIDAFGGVDVYGSLQSGEEAVSLALDTSAGNAAAAERQRAIVSAFISQARLQNTNETGMMSLMKVIFSGLKTDAKLKTLAYMGKEILKADNINFKGTLYTG